ncbi:MAG TPA: hypothetical protein VM598_03075 [Bdellovibrionota bacterium]|nr:hypothetical protein [Bdellovibrionota bacterium]
MLRAERLSRNGELTFFLSGELNESADLQSLIGSPPPKICINTRRVTGVNSAGISLWLKYVERLIASGVKIRYAECSYTFTNCLRYLVGAHNRGCVDSVVGPFSCAKCEAEFEVLIKTPDILAIKPQITGQVCPDCRGPLEFDELPAEYFSFLSI